MKKTKKQKPPPGWDEACVRRLAEHYDKQTEEDQLAEIEAALKSENITMMAVPTELVPQVLTLIKRSKRPA